MLETVGGVILICLGWAGFGLIHSLPARASFKREAERLWGPSFVAGLYRPLYSLAAVLYALGLWVYSASLPGDRILFSIPLWMSFFPYAAKAAAAVLIAVCFREISFSEFTGAGQFLRWWHGETMGVALTPPEETPAVQRQEPLACGGAYLWVRHPLNTAAFLWIWSQAHYTLYSIVFAVCLTGYVLIANRYEEEALLVRYGPAYERYRKIVPAFFSDFSDLPYRTETLKYSSASQEKPPERSQTSF